jgi:hypothetical protein
VTETTAHDATADKSAADGPAVGESARQGHPSGGEGLVEGEGLNAGSSTTEPAPDSAGDVTSGGAPERAPHPSSDPDVRDDVLGTPERDAGTPGQQLSVGEG